MAQYIIGSKSKSSPSGMSISKSPKIHTSKKTATIEAERLARTDPTREFVLMEIVSVLSYDPNPTVTVRSQL